MKTGITKRFALISVTDKAGVDRFASRLVRLGFTILSTGGTAQFLRDHGIAVKDVSDHTGSPEILGGRVKTLHPKIHGGILLDRSNPKHQAEAEHHGIDPIEVVVVNLYRFADAAAKADFSLEEAIHHIDIGGPTMLRAAAKNYSHCLAVVEPSDYDRVAAALAGGLVDETLRLQLAAKVFGAISAYDALIANAFAPSTGTDGWPRQLTTSHGLKQSLRYGENPHQRAALYSGQSPAGIAGAETIQGKELSYNNFLDLDAAAQLLRDLTSQPAVAIIKHTNPCGVAIDTLAEGLFRRAYAADPKSAFGGVVACNFRIKATTAQEMLELFLEVVIAPDYHPEALGLFQTKKNLRLLKCPELNSTSQPPQLQFRTIWGGLLVQTADTAESAPEKWLCVTRTGPTPAQVHDLAFAMTVAKHVKSNAIVLARQGVTVGIGAGQMSRIDSATIAFAKAKAEGHILGSGVVLASDAFFPFADTVELAAQHGISAIIQPGGSIRDQESVEAADRHGIAMVYTGQRHFRH